MFLHRTPLVGNPETGEDGFASRKGVVGNWVTGP